MARSIERLDGSDGWELSDAEYQQLKADSDWLACLEAAGVDNWEGYSQAASFSRGEDDPENF